MEPPRTEAMSIPEFFAGRTLLLTGASGFMGKVLLEKLLRSCPDIARVYILMRPKREKGVVQRTRLLLNGPLFKILRGTNQDVLSKVVALEGDVAELGLGLTEHDKNTLRQEVSVVFHCAASVRFDDPLKTALHLNTRSAVEMVALCRSMPHLAVLAHVSTTYCNTHQAVIKEQVYPAPADWRQMLKLCDTADSHTFEVMSAKILEEYPNTYTFTKALAEQVILDHRDAVRSVIFRPSIVISTIEEPIPGWIDNFNGPMGLVTGVGKGVIKAILCDPDVRSDYIPVDLAIKALITAAWDTAVNREKLEMNPPVYNCSMSEVQQLNQRTIMKLGKELNAVIPFEDALWLPWAYATTSTALYYLYFFLFQFLPALIIDEALVLSNRKPKLLAIQRKIFLANFALSYFTTKEWTFKNDRLQALEDRLDSRDQPNFKFFLRREVFKQVYHNFFRDSTLGIKRYLLKESISEVDIQNAKRQYWRLVWVDRTAKAILAGLIVYMAFELQLVQFATSLATRKLTDFSQSCSALIHHLNQFIFSLSS